MRRRPPLSSGHPVTGRGWTRPAPKTGNEIYHDRTSGVRLTSLLVAEIAILSARPRGHGVTPLRRRRNAEITDRQQALEIEAAGGEVGGPSFQAIDDCHDLHHFAAEFTDAVDCLQGAAAGRDYVIHDHDLHARLDRAFDESLRPVPFRLSADEKPEQLSAAPPGGREHAADDRVGADRHAADRLEVEALQEVEQPFADELQAFGMQRNLLAVEVIAGLLPRSESEFAEFEGPLTKEL